jgi:hypothetical protein
VVQQVGEILGRAEPYREREEREFQCGAARESLSSRRPWLGNFTSAASNHRVRQNEASASKPQFVSDFDERSLVDAASIYKRAVGGRQIAQFEVTVFLRQHRVML